MLAGQKELAERMTRTERQRTSIRQDNEDDQASTSTTEGPETEEGQAESAPARTTETSSEVVELPRDIVKLVELAETGDQE